jgi:hypothetical protein
MTTEAIGQGTGTWARGFGGMGVFIDEDGDDDRYVKGSPGQNNAVWTQGTYGAGVSLPAKPKPETPAEETTFVPDSTKAKRPAKDVFKDASVWQVGEARNKTRKARKELITLGAEAARYIAQEKLNTKDGLELDAITEFAKSLPDTMAPFLFKGLRETNRWTRSNCAYLIGQAKVRNGVDSLLAALKLPGFRPRSAILAFGELGDKKVVPVTIPYLKDGYEPTRIATAATLGKLKDVRGVSSLIDALGDRLFTVRSAAEQALVDIGDTAVGYLLSVQPAGKAVVHYLRALGTLAAKLDTVAERRSRIESRKRLLQYLDDASPAARGVAVEALGKLLDAALREQLERKMPDEADGFVLGKYRAVLGKGQ